ncbi:peptidyl-prolyl cis-trans isomerase [Ruegeria lacuscaerulensis]|uniref:peptidylprolyl isomerase n=1 Tax=Ruegeria lacuscaerulensis TaxID=55218 RepID=UPI00147E8872|nr:peptidylprolyl isomerase [Ruegeria lacuscaerulensis]
MRVFKEPLFHFVLIGLAIFGWFYLVTPEGEYPEPGEIITVDNKDLELLISRFETSWNRPPNNKEIQALIDALVREEVLVREARKLGLDQGDQVIRARLARKMDFLTSAVAASVIPEDDVLEEFLAANPERFSTSPRIAFDQVYLGETPKAGDVELTLAALNSGSDWSAAGLQSLLPKSMPLSANRVVDSAFGQGFAKSLEQLEPDVWSGPIQSGYGYHLARITGSSPAKLPPLEDIRDIVLQEWRRETGEELAQAQYDSLVAHYQIELPVFEEAKK